MEDKEFMAKISTTLASVLADVQSYAPKNDLVHRNPKRWLEMAGLFVQGKSYNYMREQGFGNFYVMRKVKAQLDESPAAGDIKREFAVRTALAIDANLEIMEMAGEALREKYDSDDEEVKAQIKNQPLREMHQNMRESAVASQVLINNFSRLRGDAPPVQRVEHVISYDKMLEEVKAARKKELGFSGGSGTGEVVQLSDEDVEVVDL
jgi:hypothetical protein